MTDVVFFKKGDDYTGFECSGHSGFGAFGNDIVCSALSSITQSCALGLKEVLRLNVKIEKDERRGYLKVELPWSMFRSDEEKAQVLLKTLYLSVKDLAKNYPRYINLEEK